MKTVRVNGVDFTQEEIDFIEKEYKILSDYYNIDSDFSDEEPSERFKLLQKIRKEIREASDFQKQVFKNQLETKIKEALNI